MLRGEDDRRDIQLEITGRSKRRTIDCSYPIIVTAVHEEPYNAGQQNQDSAELRVFKCAVLLRHVRASPHFF